MERMIKLLWNIGAAIFWGILIIGTPFWVFPFAMLSGCDINEHQSFISPDNEKEAVVLIVNCGATTRWETQIVVRELADKDNQNILVRLDGHPEEIAYKVSWKPENTIAITEFNFNDLLSFHSRNLTGDIAKSIIQPKTR